MDARNVTVCLEATATYEPALIPYIHAPRKTPPATGWKLDRICHDPACQHSPLKGFPLYFAPDSSSLIRSSSEENLSFSESFDSCRPSVD